MKIGDLDIYVLQDGTFRLDGGAMFGVVPKVLWEKKAPADARNRIFLGLNSLLIIRENDKILIDTGIGDKYDAKFADMFSVQQERNLLQRLDDLDIRPEDITHVIMSHMHFDHIGWNTRRNEAGDVVPTFPNAVYFAQQGEYDTANHPDPRSKASYLIWNWQPLEQSGQLQLLQGTGEVVPGIDSIITGGHTQSHSTLKITSGRETIVFLADLVPTTAHLRTAWVMGYDTYPLQTMEMKPNVLQQALDEQWLLVFEHDAHTPLARLSLDGGRMVAVPVGGAD